MSNNSTHYVKQLNINGVNVVQVPCIELQGVPNAATVGAVGLLGMDVTTGGNEVYICTAVNGAIYTWMPLKDGKDGAGVIRAVVNYKGELELTLSDGTMLNAGNVVGPQGANITNIEINDKCELVFTLSDQKVVNVGKVLPTMQDLLGTEPIGELGGLYYNGETFVERPLSLEEASWKQIIAVAEAGRADAYFRVGEEKTVELTTGELVKFVILGFNHDTLEDGSGKAGITFGMKDLLSTKYQFHTNNNTVEYSASSMHTSTLPNRYAMLPPELRTGIKRVQKKTTLTSGGTTNVSCQLFLFSREEVWGGYEYYNGDNSLRVKKLGASGSIASWWIREYNSYLTWEAVTADGATVEGSTSASTTSKGVCFGFCI